MARHLTNTEKSNIKSLYLEGNTSYQVAETIGCGQMTCLRVLNKDGVTRKQFDTVRTYSLDDSFFDIINTEAKIRLHSSIFTFSTGGNQMPKILLRKLYKNSTVYLDRKKELVNSLLTERS